MLCAPGKSCPRPPKHKVVGPGPTRITKEHFKDTDDCVPHPPPQFKLLQGASEFKAPQRISKGSQFESHWARGPLSLLLGSRVGELCLGHTEENLLEWGTRVTWKGGHQSELLNPRKEKDLISCLEPQRETLSLSLCPAESPNELSLPSLPPRLASMLSAQQGLLGPHFHTLSRGRAPSFSKKPSVLSLSPLNPPFPSHL